MFCLARLPLAVENIATLFEWPDAELDEASFVRAVLERTGAPLLLDLSNLYANARNHGFDALAYLDALPLERLAYIHVAGGVERHGIYHDTHAHALPGGPLDLVEETCARCAPPGILLERDDNFPPPAELHAELDAIAAAMERGARRRELLRVG